MANTQAIIHDTPILRSGGTIYQLTPDSTKNDWYFQVTTQPRDALREAVLAQKLQELLAVEYNLSITQPK